MVHSKIIGIAGCSLQHQLTTRKRLATILDLIQGGTKAGHGRGAHLVKIKHGTSDAIAWGRKKMQRVWLTPETAYERILHSEMNTSLFKPLTLPKKISDTHAESTRFGCLCNHCIYRGK